MQRLKKILAVALCSLVLFFDAGSSYVYAAEESIAAQNPLFIPINTFVTAALIGSGMIAKNSQQALDAGGKLVNNIISQIKSSEVAKSEADSNYDSPYRVINGGKSEKPNNDNKNGKWVAIAGGALATHDIWANKDAIKDIMSKANSLGGYKNEYSQTGFYPATDLLAESSASNIALQLAKLSNSSVTQFDKFLHSDFFEKNNLSPDDCFFNVSVDYYDINTSNPKYPQLYINVFKKSDYFKSIRIDGNPFKYRTVSSKYLNFSGYYVDVSNDYVTMLNEDNVSMAESYWKVRVNRRDMNKTDITYDVRESNAKNRYFVVYPASTYYNGYFYFGYKWTVQNPIQFTNNVYNVNMPFDENFQNWLQGQIQGLGDQIIDAVRLGLTSISPSWNPNQEQIQAGTSPDNVIYQFINNYENPENVPDEPQPNPDPDPEPDPGPDAISVDQAQTALKKLMQQGIDYIAVEIPNDFWNKIPFSIPYDIYLLIHGIFVGSSGGGKRSPQRVASNGSNMPVGDPSNVGIEIDIPTVPLKYTEEKTEDTPPNFTFTLNIPYTTPDGQTANFSKEFTIETARYNYFAKIIKFSIGLLWLSSVFQWLLAIFSKG